MLVKINLNINDDVKRYNPKKYYLQKSLVKNYKVIINGKNFYDKTNGSDIKRCKEIRNLTTRQDGDYTTGCVLDYDYVKNHYKLIAVNLSTQKSLDGDPKAIQQTDFVGKLNRVDRVHADGTQ